MMKLVKYFAWLLLLVGVFQIYNTLTQPGPRYIEKAIYCDYFAGGWHCQDNSPQTLAVDTATWARYMLPFDVFLMLIGGAMLYGASKANKRFVWAAFVALVALFVVQKNHTPRVYVNRQAEKTVSEPQSQSLPQKVQTAVVTVWTQPNRSPVTSHTEMYPQEDTVLYLAYKNAVVFPGFDSALMMQTGQYSVVNAGGFPTRYSSTASYVLYDVSAGWSRFSDLNDVGRSIVQHFCQDEHLALYEVVDRQHVDYSKGPEQSNLVSVCNRPIHETAVPVLAATSGETFAPSDLLQEDKYSDYTIRIYRNGGQDGMEGLEILKQGTRAYADQNSSFGIGTGEEEDVHIPPIGADVTGLGIPDLVVKEYSGGAHCCTSVDVFELGNNFRKIVTLEQADCDGATFKRQNDGGYLFYGCDPVVRMPGSSFADSAVPQVILRYANGSFHMDSDLMRKRPPSIEDLKAKAAEVASNPTWSTQDVPGAFWQYVIDLTYSGSAHSVDQFIALSWPAQRRDKDQRMQEFLSQLKKSPYWTDIQALNAHQ